MSETKLNIVHKMLDQIRKNLEQVEVLVRDIESGKSELTEEELSRLETESSRQADSDADRGRIIEGVFDGYQMIGPDGTKYSVPPNYASKSKLVEGDLLKLTIAPDSAFIYKQIRPIERERIRGKLVRDKETNEYRVLVDKKLYRVLLASVTYYRGEVGDEVVLLVPTGGMTSWAAVDHIIKSGESGDRAFNPFEGI
jgi:hypothetical protein